MRGIGLIYKHEDCEYSITLADLMVTLDKLESFRLMIWLRGNELPFEMNSRWDLEFMQESIKCEYENKIVYLLYDEIVAVMVMIK